LDFVEHNIGSRVQVAQSVSKHFVQGLEGYSRHHWSYLTENFTDVILIRSDQHFDYHGTLTKIHDLMCFKNGEILDTKEKALKSLSGYDVVEIPRVELPEIPRKDLTDLLAFYSAKRFPYQFSR
jgi:hypothetical protein